MLFHLEGRRLWPDWVRRCRSVEEARQQKKASPPSPQGYNKLSPNQFNRSPLQSPWQWHHRHSGPDNQWLWSQVHAYTYTVNIRERKLSLISRKWAFHGENFHGMLNQLLYRWVGHGENFRWGFSNHEIHESFLPRKFPIIHYIVDIAITYSWRG